MNSTTFRIWTFLLSFLVVSAAFAQEQVSGIVTDEDGSPIVGATIQLLDNSLGTVSDVNGSFFFENLSPGNYKIEVSAIGFKKATQSFSLSQGEGFVIKVLLEVSTFELQSITVTAEKREDQLQKVPLAVTAVGAKRIGELQISNINEIGRITPNFRTYDDGGGNFPLVSTRGITTIDNTPVVGVYVDDVPLFNTTSFPSYFGDIERIEVLKGPQGTLYGRNSIGGVINIISKKPTNYTQGFVSAGYGNLNQYDLQAGISTPIIKDKLFARLNMGTSSRDGYIENTFLNNTDLLGREVYTGNLRLSFIPNNKWSFALNSGIENRETNAYAFIGGFGATGQVLDSLVANHPYQVSQNTNGVYITNAFNNAFKVGFDSEKIHVDAITAFQFTRAEQIRDDFDFTEFDLTENTYSKNDISTISQEIRIASNDDGDFSWTGGVYLYHVENENSIDRQNGADNAFFAPTPEIAAQYPFSNVQETLIEQNGFSVFGQASYRITEKLTLTGGLRFELENSSLEVDSRFEKDGQPYTYPALGAVPAQFSEETQFNALSPKLNLAYQLSESKLAYINVARGYRPGGVNPFVFDADQATFDPEFSWNYEAGMKNSVWNNRARINASVFYITYEGQQLFNVIDLTNFNVGRENIGNSRSYGVELETEVVLAKGLNFIGNIGYLETEFTDYTYFGFTGSEINNDGKEQVVSPNWSGNIGLNYGLDLSSKWKASVVIDYQFQSDMFLDPENTATVPAYGLLNSQMVFGSKALELAFWAKNITDVTYLSYGYSISGSGVFGSYGLPRTYGFTVTVKF